MRSLAALGMTERRDDTVSARSAECGARINAPRPPLGLAFPDAHADAAGAVERPDRRAADQAGPPGADDQRTARARAGRAADGAVRRGRGGAGGRADLAP